VDTVSPAVKTIISMMAHMGVSRIGQRIGGYGTKDFLACAINIAAEVIVGFYIALAGPRLISVPLGNPKYSATESSSV
jgi:hypothetical protein